MTTLLQAQGNLLTISTTALLCILLAPQRGAVLQPQRKTLLGENPSPIHCYRIQISGAHRSAGSFVRKRTAAWPKNCRNQSTTTSTRTPTTALNYPQSQTKNHATTHASPQMLLMLKRGGWAGARQTSTTTIRTRG